MATAKVIIDASNLRSGGGLQVGASFIDELLRLVTDPGAVRAYPWITSARIEASAAVLDNLQDSTSSQIHCLDRAWSSLIRPAKISPRCDVRFTVFGPFYGDPNAHRHIIGFADPTLLSANRYGTAPRLLHLRSLRQHVRTAVAKRSFKSADRLVVETAAVRDDTASSLDYPREAISTVPNTINRVFTQPDLWAPTSFSAPEEASATFAFVSRLHPHKNMDFIGQVGMALRTDYSLEVRFVLTLTEQEWARLTQVTRDFSINVGALRINQVPTLLKQVDGYFFPSLFECYSAAPIEAMALRVPLFASDRDFVRTSCFDYPIYFEPRDPCSAAAAIASTIHSDQLTSWELTDPAAAATLDWSARHRALAYLDVISGELGNVL